MNNLQEWRDILLPGLQHLRGRAYGDLRIIDEKLIVIICKWWKYTKDMSYIPDLSVRIVPNEAMVMVDGASVFVKLLEEMCNDIGA